MTLPAGWEGYEHDFLGLEEPWCHPDRRARGATVLHRPLDLPYAGAD
jgi:agmatinase